MIAHNVNYFIISSTFLSAPLTFWLEFEIDQLYLIQTQCSAFRSCLKCSVRDRTVPRSSLTDGFYLYNCLTERTGLKDAHKTEVFLPGEGNSSLVLNFCIFLFSYIFYIFTFIYVLFKSKYRFPKALKSIHPYLPSRDIPWISDGSGMNAVQGLRISCNLFLATYTGQILGK